MFQKHIREAGHMFKIWRWSLLLLLGFSLSGCTTWRNEQGVPITLEDEMECEDQCSYTKKYLVGASYSICLEDCKRAKGFTPDGHE